MERSIQSRGNYYDKQIFKEVKRVRDEEPITCCCCYPHCEMIPFTFSECGNVDLHGHSLALWNIDTTTSILFYTAENVGSTHGQKNNLHQEKFNKFTENIEGAR